MNNFRRHGVEDELEAFAREHGVLRAHESVAE
jgi:hypothetical protein